MKLIPETHLPECNLGDFITVYLTVIFIGATTTMAQQQYFRIVPRDVKVHEGGEAMLECEVANLNGQVQWTKDGFALGSYSLLPMFH